MSTTTTIVARMKSQLDWINIYLVEFAFNRLNADGEYIQHIYLNLSTMAR